jgi:hypothetical protein
MCAYPIVVVAACLVLINFSSHAMPIPSTIQPYQVPLSESLADHDGWALPVTPLDVMFDRKADALRRSRSFRVRLDVDLPPTTSEKSLQIIPEIRVDLPPTTSEKSLQVVPEIRILTSPTFSRQGRHGWTLRRHDHMRRYWGNVDWRSDARPKLIDADSPPAVKPVVLDSDKQHEKLLQPRVEIGELLGTSTAAGTLDAVVVDPEIDLLPPVEPAQEYRPYPIARA